MKVIVISKTTMAIAEFANVSNIAFGATDFTITDNGTNYVYSKDGYNIQILW